MPDDLSAIRAAAVRLETLMQACALRIEDFARRPAGDDDELRRELRTMQLLRHDMHRVLACYRSLGPVVDPVPSFSPGQPFPLSAREYFEAVTYRLLLVGSALEALLELGNRPDLPLFHDSDPTGMITAQWAVTDAVLRRLHDALRPDEQDAMAQEHGCFADIPLPSSDFVTNCQAALRVALAQGRLQPLRFLDVGCGSGVKVVMAAEVFGTADGLEYDPGYVAVAEQLLRGTRHASGQIHHGDALTYEGYGSYDVIYFFRPMRDTAQMMALERRIAAEAAPGTILIAPYEQFIPRAPDLGCVAMGGSVYVTGITEAEAEALLAVAQRIGPRVTANPLALDPRSGYTGPVLRACRARGVGVI